MQNSFKYAFQGFKDALRSEPNFSVNLIFGVVALIFAYFFKFTNSEWAILILTIFSVITLELVNTIVEKIVDMHGTKITEAARVIKDISACVVLLASVSALTIGAILFIPKLGL